VTPYELNILACCLNDTGAIYIQAAGKYKFYTPFSNPFTHIEPINFSDIEGATVFASAQIYMGAQHPSAPMVKKFFFPILRNNCIQAELNPKESRSVERRAKCILRAKWCRNRLQNDLLQLNKRDSIILRSSNVPCTQYGLKLACSEVLNEFEAMFSNEYADALYGYADCDWKSLFSGIGIIIQSSLKYTTAGTMPPSEQKCKEIMLGLERIRTQIMHISTSGLLILNGHASIEDSKYADLAARSYRECVLGMEAACKALESNL